MHPLIRNPELPRELSLRVAGRVPSADYGITFAGREGWVRQRGQRTQVFEETNHGGIDRFQGRTVLGPDSPYGPCFGLDADKRILLFWRTENQSIALLRSSRAARAIVAVFMSSQLQLWTYCVWDLQGVKTDPWLSVERGRCLRRLPNTVSCWFDDHQLATQTFTVQIVQRMMQRDGHRIFNHCLIAHHQYSGKLAGE